VDTFLSEVSTVKDKIKNVVEENIKYLTQTELAARWHVSPGTIINWREKGSIPFFQVPGSSKMLYPIEKISELEKQNTTLEKEGNKQKTSTEIKRKKPVMSAKDKKWRI